MSLIAPTIKWPGFSKTNMGEPAASVLVGGDFCPIRGYETKVLKHEPIFHQAIKDLVTENYAICNLECPLCDKETPAESPSGAGLRGEPVVAEYLHEIGVDAVGLANNHMRDFGDEGVRQTIRYLDCAGVLNTGAGENLTAAEEPLEVTVNDLKIGIWALAEKEHNLAAANRPGTSWFQPERNVLTIGKMKEKFDFLMVFVHAGHEFTAVPSPRIRESYRAFIDAGADAVIGHHPHVIQGVEKYADGLIAYSLGNLVFDSPYVSSYPNTDTGYLIRLNVGRHVITEAQIIPYKMMPEHFVVPLNLPEFRKFEQDFLSFSDSLKNEEVFTREWEAAVKYRWERDYKQVLGDFSKNLNDPENQDYARRSRNLFACPTHTEIIEKIFLMLEEGKLSRT